MRNIIILSLAMAIGAGVCWALDFTPVSFVNHNDLIKVKYLKEGWFLAVDSIHTYRSTNHGASWSTWTTPDDYFIIRDMDCVDSANCMICGGSRGSFTFSDNYFAKSSNGGLTWTTNSGEIGDWGWETVTTAIDFISRNIGFCNASATNSTASNGINIVKTTNGWFDTSNMANQTVIYSSEVHGGDYGHYYIVQMQFFDSNKGNLLLYDGRIILYDYFVYGDDPPMITIVADDIQGRGLHFRDELFGIVVGSDGFISKTPDGGISWRELSDSIPTEASLVHLNHVIIHDPLIVVAGNEGIIITSTDEGASWSIEETYTMENLNYMDIIGNKLIVCGNYGTLIESDLPSSIKEIPQKPHTLSLTAFPNPFNSSCAITAPAGAEIKIYDLRGNVVGTHPCVRPVNANANDTQGQTHGSVPTSRTFIWTPDQSIASGIYLVKARTADGRTAEKKVVYLR